MIMVAIPAVMILFYNQKANWHYHITDKGFVIEHAHPFKNSQSPDSPYQKHKHCESEYFLLAQLSNIATTLVILIAIAGFIQPLRPNHIEKTLTLFFPKLELSARLLRAPPASNL
jgi:hypothetical protein